MKHIKAMQKKYMIVRITAMIMTVLLIMTMTVSCQGPQGPQGEKGDTGAQGEKGDTGAAGAQGAPGLDGKDGVNGKDGEDGKDGTTPHIGENGNWWIGTTDTGIRAEGKDGQDGKDGADGEDGKDGLNGKDGVDGEDGKDGTTPHIGENGNWWIGTTDTGIRAEGKDGQDGQDGKDGADGEDGKDGLNGKDGVDGEDGKDGKDGTTPHIGENGNWWIGTTDTGIRAEGKDGQDGQDGKDGADGEDGKDGLNGKDGVDGEDGKDGKDGTTPHIGENGNWWIGTTDTGIRAEGKDGQDGKDGADGEDGKDGKDGLNGKDGVDGEDGKDGTTPHIGENGNWWIGTTDTGIRAEGKDGQDGKDGADGEDGKDGKDGADGEDGKDGLNGKDGVDGEDGKDGTTPHIGENGNWWIGDEDTGIAAAGKDGVNGQDGKDGKDGADGEDGKDGQDGKDGEKGDPGENGADGVDGKTPVFRVDNGWLQWKYEGESVWHNLYEVNGTPAPEGLVKVRYSVGGGRLPDGVPYEVNVTAGTSIYLPTPEYDGYAFDGWYIDGESYPVTSPYRVHESITLTAHWVGGETLTGIKIYTMNDLSKIKDNLEGTYVLMNDIDCGGLGLPTIGESAQTPFRGIFDGQGYTISNFKVSSSQYMGLFGYNAGTIRNLNVKDVKLQVENFNNVDILYVGGIAAYNAGIIEKCSVQNGDINVLVFVERYAGLITAYSTGTVQNCYVTGNVYVNQSEKITRQSGAGGLVGYNNGLLSSCYASATVAAHGYYDGFEYAGILTGIAHSKGTVSNCLILGGSVDGNGSKGDIGGCNYGTASNCYKIDSVEILNASVNLATSMTAEQLQNVDFYTVSLGWDRNVWNITNLNMENGRYPTLNQK